MIGNTKKKRKCVKQVVAALRVLPVQSWLTRPFSSSKRVSSWSHRTRVHHWHLNTKTPLADRSDERRLCSRVRETRRSAISLVQMTKKSLRFLGEYSVSPRKTTPSLSGDNSFNELYMHKVDYAWQELVWQLKTICRYKDGLVHSNCSNGTLSSSLNHSNCSRLKTESTELKNKITA